LFKQFAALLFNNRRAKDALSVEEVDKLFSAAFAQIPGLQEVGKFVLYRSF
jgi:hypothetical protein